MKRRYREKDLGRQKTLDGSCLHIWKQYTAQPETDPPREICRNCGAKRLTPDVIKRETFSWEKRPWHEW